MKAEFSTSHVPIPNWVLTVAGPFQPMRLAVLHAVRTFLTGIPHLVLCSSANYRATRNSKTTK